MLQLACQLLHLEDLLLVLLAIFAHKLHVLQIGVILHPHILRSQLGVVIASVDLLYADAELFLDVVVDEMLEMELQEADGLETALPEDGGDFSLDVLVGGAEC